MLRDQGFTLMEVMIATFIMAILSVMGTTLLGNVLETRDQVEAAVGEVQELQLAHAIIREDMGQLSPRQTRDEFGELQPVSFLGGDLVTRERLLAFVRNGHIAPGEAVRAPTLQYVEYLLIDNQLIRRTRYRLDAAPQTPVRDRVLLTSVEDLRVEFSNGVTWLEEWTLKETGGEPQVLPSAIAFEFTLPKFGSIRTVFATPAGY